MKSSASSTTDGLFDNLCASLERAYGGNSQLGDIVSWAESLLLDGRRFSLGGHEYQRDILTETAPRQCFLKGAQVEEAIMGVKVREKTKGSGEWYIFIDYKNKRKAKKIGKDKKLAHEAANKIAAKLTLGQLDILEEEAVAPTLKEYVSGDNLGWLETRAKLSLKKST